jgi:hypothetical protein
MAAFSSVVRDETTNAFLSSFALTYLHELYSAGVSLC